MANEWILFLFLENLLMDLKKLTVWVPPSQGGCPVRGEEIAVLARERWLSTNFTWLAPFIASGSFCSVQVSSCPPGSLRGFCPGTRLLVHIPGYPHIPHAAHPPLPKCLPILFIRPFGVPTGRTTNLYHPAWSLISRQNTKRF